MAISSIGVGSGLPLAELLDNLRASQQAPLQAIKNQQTKTESRISGYGQLKVELENLAKAAKALEGTAFETLKSTVTGNDFTAVSKTGAIEATYDIKVTALARAQTLVTAGITSQTAANGSGGLVTFTVNGEERTLDLTGKGTSLKEVAAAINAQEDLGVRASIINNGSDEPYQLMITSTKTGLQASVSSITVQGNSSLESILAFGDAGSTVHEQAASNAQMTINGIQITSQTNTVSTAIENVTFELKAASGEQGQLKVEKDIEGVTKAIEAFVNAYNDVNKKIKQLTSYDVASQTGAALVGDSITRSIQTKLAGAITTPSSGAFQILSQIGIRTGDGGLLTVDKNKLAEAMNKDMQGVKDLFMGENGLAVRTANVTKQFTDTRDGTLVKLQEGANNALKNLSKDYDRANDRLEAQMEVYRKQFTAMDALVAQMNSVASYLTQQLSNLGGMKK